MKILIMADIHGNLEALERILAEADSCHIQGCVLLGDLIDYGMHSNEVVRRLLKLQYPMLCNLRGNHEEAILQEDYARFSSERGRESARHTRERLDQNTWRYIKDLEKSGKQEFRCGGKYCLGIHGSLEDCFWKGIIPEQDLDSYSSYDYVFSGHSHRPHFFERFYPAQDARRRNLKKTIFINPGSVGQPRNLNPMAQAAVLDMDTENVVFLRATYDIAKEQQAFDGQVDSFYSERLEYGV
ncbi:MAG: metallophosphoesterase family protein [Acetatifactor sp.]|nr:metallophosphoesterase family protein [Acetatifactor sp.]